MQDEVLIEITKPKERLGFLYCSWHKPILDSIKFSRVHGDVAGFNNHPEVFNLLSIESALLWFQ